MGILMQKYDFDQSTLFCSLRSPFARRVRICFLENGVKFEEKMLNIFQAQPELTAINPLTRVPTVLLKNGEVLIDSSQILQVFYEACPESPFAPQGVDKLLFSRWSAIAVGLCEKSV